MKKWPTTREAIRKARTTVDGSGDVVTVPGEKGESTSDAEESHPQPDTERNGNDTVPVGKKRKA